MSRHDRFKRPARATPRGDTIPVSRIGSGLSWVEPSGLADGTRERRFIPCTEIPADKARASLDDLIGYTQRGYEDASHPDVLLLREIRRHLPVSGEVTPNTLLHAFSQALLAVDASKKPAAFSVARDCYNSLFHTPAPRASIEPLYFADGVAARDTVLERSPLELAMLGSRAVGCGRD